MYHSITFGEKNSWDDWYLIPTSRPVVAQPKVKTKYIDIPGADGQLDLTELLAGRPLYDMRTGSWEFILQPENWAFEDAISVIMGYLHGRRMRVILEDDPGWYYEGRLEVNALKCDKFYNTITINYSLGPYKYSLTGDEVSL